MPGEGQDQGFEHDDAFGGVCGRRNRRVPFLFQFDDARGGFAKQHPVAQPLVVRPRNEPLD